MGSKLTTPLTLSSVINFKAWMSLNGHKSLTIVSYISGISYYLKLNGWVDVTEVFIVRKMLKGLQRSRPSSFSLEAIFTETTKC